MKHNECIAMLLAGGQGSRLKDLTKKVAKPAVSFGGKYRIIDFSLSNCLNSGINTVGVLTQYKPYLLNSYIGNGEAWDFNGENGGLFILPPFFTELGGKWYDGTADAIFSNIDFMDKFNPEYVLILSGDHLYKMNYNEMLEFTKLNNSDLTVSVIKVPLEDVSRFGIMSIDENNRIIKFQEKPKKSDSTLASMGIYIFKYDVLRKILIMDHNDEKSEHDFGKNIIPKLISDNYNLYAYEFKGYWQDVGTIDSYFVANMQLLDEKPLFDIFEKRNKIYSNNNIFPPHFVGKNGSIKNSLICNGCIINGCIESSIVAGGVVVERGAKVIDSIIFPGTKIKKGAKIYRAILGESVIVEENATVGSMDKNSEIELIGDENIIKNEGRKE